MITRRGLLMAAAAMPFMPSPAGAAAVPSWDEISPGLAATFAKIDRFSACFDRISKAVDSDEFRVVWVSGWHQTGKTTMARILLDKICHRGPSTLHLPTQDAKREFLRAYREDMPPWRVTAGARELLRATYRYVVVDDVDEHNDSEGLVVLHAVQRTLTWQSGKVIAFSASPPPKPLRCEHICLPNVI